MGEGHFGKAKGEIGLVAQGVGVAEGAANNEGDVAVAGQG